MKAFGKASDFYRLRVLKVNEDSDLDLDWRKDILFREPPITSMSTKVWYIVQVVDVDDKNPKTLKCFAGSEAAIRFKDRAEKFLVEMTKKQFESKFPSVSGKERSV